MAQTAGEPWAQPNGHHRPRNLTELEMLALMDEVNVSDGHARQELTHSQRDIIDGLGDLFHEAIAACVPELDRRAQRAFLDALGQRAAPVEAGRVLSCYASSVAIEILARALAGSVRSVRLIHPTFDNIPDILEGVGIELVPIDEDVLAQGDLSDLLPVGSECLFLTTPNNPTGRVLDAERLTLIAQECARQGVLLVLDTSFRGFDSRAQYDHYAILHAAGTRYAVIEDTGKLWPLLDVKVGLLVHSEHIDLPIGRFYTDLLLGVSPFVLLLVERLAQDAAAGGLEALHEQMCERRAVVRAALGDIEYVSFPDLDSRTSVERIALQPPLSGTEVWRRLRSRRVHVLPCGHFHWARQAEGDHFIRLALARPLPVVRAAAHAVRDLLAPHGPELLTESEAVTVADWEPGGDAQLDAAQLIDR